MKRALLIIMSVAVLGALGLYINKKPASTSASVTNTSPTAVAADQTSSASNTPAASNSTDSNSSSSGSQYKDGTYTGKTVNNIYGPVQVAAVVSGGKITDIQFLQMPSDEQNSKVVTAMAKPQLKSETLQTQSAHIDFVSGATQTSESYEQSLQAALDQAAIG